MIRKKKVPAQKLEIPRRTQKRIQKQKIQKTKVQMRQMEQTRRFPDLQMAPETAKVYTQMQFWILHSLLPVFIMLRSRYRITVPLR